MGLLSKSAPNPRDYQIAIAKKAKNSNTLVVLPTGMGKTLIAVLVMEEHLTLGKKVIILAPTKPLCEQHQKTMRQMLDVGGDKIALITGGIPAKKRQDAWENATIALATPQTLENDLKGKRASLEGVGLVVFDEAHRCVGKYAYTYISEKCKESDVRVLGLTASPGWDERKIRSIMETLGIDTVEIRNEEDEDVKGYVQQVDVKWVDVDLPEEMGILKKGLEELIRERSKMFVSLGLLGGSPGRISKRRLIEIGRKIRSSSGGWKYSALSLYAEIFNLVHAHELLETQGIGTFLDFFERMGKRAEKSKAVMRLLMDKRVEKMLEQARQSSVEHPKMKMLAELIKERPGKTFIVFVSYRDQITRIVDQLSKEHGVTPVRFVGKKDGVSQKEQKETIERFRRAEFNVLVATQIGEEGLDIPSVDCVIFYEPVPSEIRSIQRRGRAGRAKAGEVIVLITKGTRDEVYYWVSKKKEKRMKKIIGRMQKEGDEAERKHEKAHIKDFAKKGQMRISDYI
jgi:ERCC4-related helicase